MDDTVQRLTQELQTKLDKIIPSTSHASLQEKYKKITQIASQLDALINSKQIVVEFRETLYALLRVFRRLCWFVDVPHLCAVNEKITEWLYKINDRSPGMYISESER
jgi:hypothetical protein